MIVGVTSQNKKTVTGHAGKCRKFRVFESIGNDLTEHSLLELGLDETVHAAGSDPKHPIADFDVLITSGCGEGFVRKMQQMNINLVKVSPEMTVEQATEKFFSESEF